MLTSTPSYVCKNCGHSFEGTFCNQCGEKVFKESDKKISKLFGDAFHFLTHFEGTFFTTVKTIFTRPGKVSEDICNGIRKKYFKPISLFLLMVILYLLFPRFEGLNMKLSTYAKKDYGYTWLANPIIENKMSALQIPFEELMKRYTEKSAKISKIALLFFIPICALLFSLLFFKRKKPFFDHFLLSTEINCLYVFFHFLFLPFLAFLVDKIMPRYNPIFFDGQPIWFIIIGVFGLYTVLAMKRFYGEALWKTIIKGLIFLFIFVIFIRALYAILLFLLVMLFI